MSESNKIRAVYRLSRSYWKSGNSINCKISLTRLARKSTGYKYFEEECDMGGCDLAWKHIINLNECKDGIYELITVNISKDWETGYVDDYDFKLIPYMTEKDK